MKRDLTNKIKTVAFAAALSFVTSNAMALITAELGGSTETAGWDELNGTRLPAYNATSLGGFPGFGAWPGPLTPNVAGSSFNAIYNKLGGTGYAGAEAIYTFPSDFGTGPGGTFLLSSTSVIADLETLIFQIDMGEGVDFLVSAPTLSYNSGSGVLAAKHTQVAAGAYDFVNPSDPGAPETTTVFAYQWDFSEVGPITDYSIVWTTAGHSTTYELSVLTGDTYSKAIPEPASGALLIGAASLLLLRRRRA